MIKPDAGHQAPTPFFGIDPQARLDYGYQAVGKLTPMAKALIASAYGKGPDRSYIGGCSNGGRHTMVAMSRYADDYDGFLVGDPGFRLPLAASANIVGAQNYNALATTPGDPGTGFTLAERTWSPMQSSPSATPSMARPTASSRTPAHAEAAFSLDRDVPTCSGSRDGTCLSADQKLRIGQLFAGALDGGGKKFYASFPFDAGLNTTGWSSWKFSNSIEPRLGCGRLRLAGAAREPDRLQRPQFHAHRQHRFDPLEDHVDRRALHRELAFVHDAAEP